MAGRPSKGPRVVLLARMPERLKHAAEDAAARHGMTVNDYVSALIARDAGLTDLTPAIQEDMHHAHAS